MLVIIHPYKQSLKIHSVGLYLNLFLCLLFFIIINAINLVAELNS